MNCHFSFFLSFFLSFFFSFLIPTSFFVLIVGVEGYSGSFWHSHTHTVGLPRRGISPSQRPCLSWHNTDKRQTSMPPVGFEPAIPAFERTQTHALGRAATGIDWNFSCNIYWETFVVFIKIQKVYVIY